MAMIQQNCTDKIIYQSSIEIYVLLMIGVVGDVTECEKGHAKDVKK